MNPLLVVQQGGSLLIRRNNSLLSSEAEFFAEKAWQGNQDRSNEENTHNYKGKDPLERNRFCEELTDPQGSSQDAKGEAHGVVLVYSEEEQAIDENSPDSNVGQDASCKTWVAGMGVCGNSTIPVQSNKSPGKRCGHNWNVNESGVSVVTEVEGR